MPIYEFYCPKCKKEFEVMRQVSKVDDPAKCPECGSNSERLMSVFASKKEYSIRVPSKDAFRWHK